MLLFLPSDAFFNVFVVLHFFFLCTIVTIMTLAKYEILFNHSLQFSDVFKKQDTPIVAVSAVLCDTHACSENDCVY